MKLIADLHIHSPYSYGTSKKGNLQALFSWARIKGVNVIGSGDFTHPGWLSHLKENLAHAEPGLFRLDDEISIVSNIPVGTEVIETRFLLSSEISCVYKKEGKTRRIHALVLAPDFNAVDKLNRRLSKIGNLSSDGRPILKLDIKHLLEMALEISADNVLIPAHIWTPWYSLFGSKSGFDSVESCFGDLSEHIFAMETGLSSDPKMNRMISALDRYTMVSNSDCHSPSKLAREATLFQTELSYYSIVDAMKDPARGGFQGTIEFCPEEGKYHYDGHRGCGVCYSPEETRRLQSICPECGRPLTIGVLNRVMTLADRPRPVYPEGQSYFESLVSLTGILSESLGVGPTSKRVTKEFLKLVGLFGSEMNLLRQAPYEEIKNRYSEQLAEAIHNVRTRKLSIKPGFDGVYGQVSALGNRCDLKKRS